jgi:hypothetical protein
MTVKELCAALVMWLPRLWKDDKAEFFRVLLQLISVICFIALYFSLPE